MNMNELLQVTGKLTIVVTDEHGNVKHNQHVNNTVMTVGKAFIAARMAGTSANVMSHMAIGSGSSNPTDPAQTALATELGRVALSVAGGTPSAAVVTYNATFGAGTGTGAVTEAGIFNASSAGTMLCRVVFAVVNKGANDTMAITWTVTVS
jgi:hypothetical protein